jgi:hypothetical protein
MLVLALACTAESSPSPPPPGSGTPSTAAAGASVGNDDDGDPTAPPTTGEPEDIECDPYADPALECGPEGVCSFVDMRCHEALGMAGVDEACMVLDADTWTGTCAPGLVCVVESGAQGTCAVPCEDDEACGVDRLCRRGVGQAPTRVCVLLCDPFAEDCPPREACYVVNPDEPVPLCAPAGPGVELDPCAVATDCAPLHHCTPAPTHMIECPDPFGCCTPLCDVRIGDCVGINPLCVPLGVADAPNLGVCVGDV